MVDKKINETEKEGRTEQIIKNIKPEDTTVDIDWEKDKEKLIKKLELTERTRLRIEIVYGLKGTLETVLGQFKYYSEIPAVKTECYHFYSVTDPHKGSIARCLKDFILKNKLRQESSYQILEVRIPLTFKEYSQKRDEFLSELGKDYHFTVNMPRKRDKLFTLLRGRLFKEWAGGKGMYVAFYEGLSGKNYLEFAHYENLKSGTDKICRSLEKLLLNNIRIMP